MAKPNIEDQRQIQNQAVLKRVEDAVHNFLYHDRAEDLEVSSALIFSLLNSKDITTSEIINTFARELRKETA